MALVGLIGLVSLVSVGCKKQTAASYPPPQSGAPTSPVTPGVGNGTAQPILAASPALPPAAPAGAPLSQPNPLALPCTQDAHCLTHRCNVAAGKCAWPCQTDNDCMPGNACISPTCLPKLQ
jgi:hypothetical protein